MSTTNDDLFAFADEAPAAAGAAGLSSERVWQVLVVDDDADVHQATLFALSDTQVFGRPIRFFHAYNAQQAREILRTQSDLALVLLDVVMETDDAGLALVDFIRNEAGLTATRIVLRTGQPGYAPEHETILRYDINDYKTKSELTRHKLLTTLTTAIRSYQQIRTIEANRRGLELIVRSSADFMEETGLHIFAQGVITQLAALMGTAPEGLVCAQAERGRDRYRVLAAAGQFAPLIDQPLDSLPQSEVRDMLGQALSARHNVSGPAGLALYVGYRHGCDMAVFIHTQDAPAEPDRSLLDIFCVNIGNLLRNRQLVQRLHEFAFYDQLVDLPNRASFVEALDRRLTAGASAEALALLDIDDFSATNDVMGHRFGDLVLNAVAQRLRQSLPPHAVIARIGSDTFGVLGPQADVHPDLLRACMREPLLIEGVAHKLSFTSAFVPIEGGAGSGADLLKDAAITLKRAKKDHKGQHLTYSPQFGAEARARALMLAELRAAFEAERFYLVYQPQQDLHTRQLVGLEALIRWRTEDGRFVPPDQFIPVAERSGLLAPLGLWVLSAACRTMRALIDQGVAPPRMAVNVSVVQLQDPAFADHVLRTLSDNGLSGQRLELEITESVAVLPTAYLEDMLRRLRAHGVSIAIDDFGTGYSSLSYLERLPLDRIKIDRSFVRQIGEDKGPRIAEMITQLGRKLGLRVLAEGIEDARVWGALHAMGCHEGQGYHIARPMDGAALLAWLRAPAVDAPPAA